MVTCKFWRTNQSNFQKSSEQHLKLLTYGFLLLQLDLAVKLLAISLTQLRFVQHDESRHLSQMVNLLKTSFSKVAVKSLLTHV